MASPAQTEIYLDFSELGCWGFFVNSSMHFFVLVLYKKNYSGAQAKY